MRTALLSGCLLLLGSGCPSSPGTPTDDGEEDPSLDPLSMPAEPTLEIADFNGAADCEFCHPNHVAEWRLSRHAYAMQDPVFQALAEQRQIDLQTEEDQFCTSCHSSLCTRGGECVPGFAFESLSERSMEGITCEACHKVESLARPYNSGHVIDGTLALGGPIEDPVDNSFHASRHDPLFSDSGFCAGCHDVLETNGLNLERPYAEWLESPAQPAGKQCQACHMPTYEGTAAVGIDTERTLHRHRFAGVELPLVPQLEQNPDLREQLDGEIDALLATAASLELTLEPSVAPGSQLDLVVTVHNEIDAHNFPTGSTNLRQVWIEITATDAAGEVLYRTGHLDDKGDLRNVWSTVAPHSDPDLLLLSSTLIDAAGQPTVFSWNATEHRSASIAPLHERTYTLFVPVPEDATGPIAVDAVLHFRAYPPFLIDMLGLTELLGDTLKVRDVASASATVEVTAG